MANDGDLPDAGLPDGRCLWWERPAKIDRRMFISVTAIAALGLASGCSRTAGNTAAPPEQGVTPTSAPAPAAVATQAPAAGMLPAGWSPIAELAAVSVAADGAARSYPRLVPGDQFDRHPAVVLLGRAISGLSGGPAVEAIRAAAPAGSTVLIKPNWVEPASWASGKITHPSLVLAVARLASQAVGPTGRVLIAEGTSEGRDLPEILSATSFMRALKDFGLDKASAGGAKVEVADLNLDTARPLRGTLGDLSRFFGVDDVMYDASGRSLGSMGEGQVGKYLIAKPVTDADLIIDFAKAKVHCSAGVTLTLKNFVGVVPSSADPSGKLRLKSLPHYSANDVRAGRKYVLNRTIGRTAADLNALVAYMAKDGSLQRDRQRKVLCLIDGVVSGERSQFSPHAVPTGWIAAGFDPVAVDHVAARCMGFDPGRVESLRPSAKGRLALGTGDASRVRLVYAGPGQFAEYFSARRALTPEVGVADWGDAIDLRARAIAKAVLERTAAGVLVRTADRPGPGEVVRLESDTGFANLRIGPDGTGSVTLPQTVGRLRLVQMDGHFNLAEQPVPV